MFCWLSLAHLIGLFAIERVVKHSGVCVVRPPSSQLFHVLQLKLVSFCPFVSPSKPPPFSWFIEDHPAFTMRPLLRAGDPVLGGLGGLLAGRTAADATFLHLGPGPISESHCKNAGKPGGSPGGVGLGGVVRSLLCGFSVCFSLFGLCLASRKCGVMVMAQCCRFTEIPSTAIPLCLHLFAIFPPDQAVFLCSPMQLCCGSFSWWVIVLDPFISFGYILWWLWFILKLPFDY